MGLTSAVEEQVFRRHRLFHIDHLLVYLCWGRNTLVHQNIDTTWRICNLLSERDVILMMKLRAIADLQISTVSHTKADGRRERFDARNIESSNLLQSSSGFFLMTDEDTFDDTRRRHINDS